jgi:hypothetical protein
MFRDDVAASGAHFSGSLLRRISREVFIADSIRWLSAMKESSRRKRPPIGAERLGMLNATAVAERFGGRLFLTLQSAGSQTDQALALLSTARSERSA